MKIFILLLTLQGEKVVVLPNFETMQQCESAGTAWLNSMHGYKNYFRYVCVEGIGHSTVPRLIH